MDRHIQKAIFERFFHIPTFSTVELIQFFFFSFIAKANILGIEANSLSVSFWLCGNLKCFWIVMLDILGDCEQAPVNCTITNALWIGIHSRKKGFQLCTSPSSTVIVVVVVTFFFSCYFATAAILNIHMNSNWLS